ncbi:MAG TPA: family 1 glycosylhydrolase [Spirochaetia bacterium]|nr:family 1 glycosylhydrolase [Spirochaetia bacterium]
MARIQFPAGFTWGAASASYQVEGSPLADGAGPSNWHEFSHRRGKVRDGSSGDLACDHYHRYREDAALVRRVGLGAYRLSVGWARIFPEKGRRNQAGLDFYSRLVDSLLAEGIEPWVTLCHLEEPLWLAREGGFTRRDSADRLAELGEIVFRTLGDRVSRWITVNEPTIHAVSGYFLGEFPPGRRLAFRGLFHCLHHLLLAHSRLCECWASVLGRGSIGCAHHAVWMTPADPARPRDVAAASFMDAVANRTVLDLLFRGTYPQEAISRVGRFFPRGFEDDMARMRAPGTYLGINYYTRIRYRWSPLIPFSHAAEVQPAGVPRSAMWEISPQGMGAALRRLREEYGNPPIVITENGFPLPESGGRDPLDDPERIAYLTDHLAEVGRAIQQGSDCRGYFHWSLMDNFEWNKGLTMRFGLLRTDFQTQERLWKKSAHWFREVVARNSVETGPVAAAG